MSNTPRVAFLTDTYHEVNGVALTSRQLQDCARRCDYPFLCVYGGDSDKREQVGSVTHMQVKRGPLAFNLDKGLQHDPALWRYMRGLREAIVAFQADIIHITSPGDVGEMGAVLAYQLKIPLVISWHTNFHEFGARRLGRMLNWLPGNLRQPICDTSERHILNAMIRFYKLGVILFAPNDELIAMLEQRTGLPVFLMKRGIDANLYAPSKRTKHDGIFRLGYVGRITPEKSVRFLVDLERALVGLGMRKFRFLIVGDGSERDWLARNLKAADLPGVLRGEALAEAYANMDLFVFSLKNRHVRQRRAGSHGIRSALRSHEPRRSEVHHRRRRLRLFRSHRCRVRAARRRTDDVPGPARRDERRRPATSLSSLLGLSLQ